MNIKAYIGVGIITALLFMNQKDITGFITVRVHICVEV